MNPTAQVIERQLANEGVYLVELFDVHMIEMGEGNYRPVIGHGQKLEKAVENAIKTTIRIGGLLAKYHDAITSGETGNLGDLLVNEDEREIL